MQGTELGIRDLSLYTVYPASQRKFLVLYWPPVDTVLSLLPIGAALVTPLLRLVS